MMVCACGTDKKSEDNENIENKETVETEEGEKEEDEGTITWAQNHGYHFSCDIVKGSKISDGSAWSIKRDYETDDEFTRDLFYEYTLNGTVTVETTVARVEERKETFATSKKDVYVISLHGGWKATVLKEFHPEVADLKKGDTVEVVSKIKSAKYDWVDIYDMEHLREESRDYTKITIK